MGKTTAKAKGALELLPGSKNIKALRGALEHSVTVQTKRLEQVVDDLVKRGKLSRQDADELVGSLIKSGKQYTSTLLQVLDSAIPGRSRKKTALKTEPKRAPASSTTSASSSSQPIAGYDKLTVTQIKPKLSGLSPSDLRAVRSSEAGGKNRKGVLAEIDRLLD